MSRKRKNTYKNGKPDLLKSLASLDFNELDRLSKTVPMLLQSKLQSSMMSRDVEDVMKANLYLGSKTSDNGKLQSVFFDPQVWNDSGRDYLAQRGILPFSTLRRMGGIYLVRAIVNTRIEQIQNFLHFSDDEQKEGYTIRKKRGLFDPGDLSLSSKDKKKVEKIVEFLERGGNTDKWDNYDTLPDFIRKISFDSLTLDQLAFETTRNRMWELDRFKAVDASLVRFLGAVDPRNRQEFEKYRFKGYLPRYCMVWDNQILKNPVTGESIVYYPWELGFGVRNKSTDVYRNGYGVSELETLNEIVTWFLWSLQSNGNSFKNGVFPKGLLNIKGENVSQTTLNEFRQMWYQMMAGPQNAGRIPVLAQSQVEWIDLQKCLHPDSEVITEDGKKTLDSILGEKESVVSKIWDGEGFEECKIYRTQEKRICSLTLSNRMTLKTSSEHKFLVLRDSKPTWVERKNIVLGDYVLVNKNVIEKKRTLTFKGKEVEWDLFELLGWMIGDGWISVNEKGKRTITLFYHPIKEDQIIEEHLAICKKYGINAYLKVRHYSKEYIELEKEKAGFKSMIGYEKRVHICDYTFHQWLFNELGITPSCEGKTVPSILFSANSEWRRAFLRGWFSADGCCSMSPNYKSRYISLTCSYNFLMSDAKLLLLSEGIKCTGYKAKRKVGKLGNVTQDNVLIIKDKELFMERIGFLHDYKIDNYYAQPKERSYYTMKESPKDLVKSLATSIRLYNRSLPKEQQLSKKHIHDVQNIGKGYQIASLEKVKYYANMVGYKLPEFVNNYSFCEVVELEESDETVRMVDVEMFNDKHQFVANGMVVHNCNKDMEYNLWNQFLIVLICSVYRIDPSELGFQFKESAQMFGQDGQRQRLKHSREKGLKPMLSFLQEIITRYLVSELDESFEFVFTGVDLEDEALKVEIDKKKLEAGMISLEDAFEAYSGRPFNPEKDTILNSVWMNYKINKDNAAAMGGQMNGGEVEGVKNEEEQPSSNVAAEEEDPFAKYKSMYGDNPIMDRATEVINKMFGGE